MRQGLSACGPPSMRWKSLESHSHKWQSQAMADLDNILQLTRGGLMRLMPRWTSPQIPVFATYPSRKFLPSRLKVFLEALAAWQSPLWNRE